jgi:hypothetical protein
MNRQGTVISPAYDREIRKTLVTQVVVGCLAFLMLDGGIAARVVLVAFLGFWLCAAVVIARRPLAPTAFDLAFIRWGFWPVLTAAMLRQEFA